MTARPLGPFSWDRIVAAVDAVRERAVRIGGALESAGIPHVIVGGNAVAAWVSRVDAAAVRNTNDVDVLVRRDDFDRVIEAAAAVVFVHQSINGVECLRDGPEGSPRSAVHLIFAGERVRSEHLLPAPDVSESEREGGFRVVTLEALVRMKLVAYRLKDRVHLLDMLEVGLVDESWCSRLPPELAARLTEVIAQRDREV